MLSSNKTLLGIFLIILSAFIVFTGVHIAESHTAGAQIRHCDAFDGDLQVDCIYRIIEKSIQERDIKRGFDIFRAAYDMFPSLSGTGCHRHAHRIGDMVYYGIYLSKNIDIKEINFPQDTTSCGYGFFHGFLEHLIQDNPDPVFVTDTCNYLRDALSHRMGDMEIICYHGSGHGFILHESENIRKEKWGDVLTFVKRPIEECESLPEADENEIEECRQGVFNVIVDWMSDREYGFSYDTENPLYVCESLDQNMQYACYYEISQKLDAVSDYDPREILSVAKKIGDENIQKAVFGTGIAGIMQQTILDGEWKDVVLSVCLDLESPFDEYCTSSVVHGLFEHGPPLREYEEPLLLCRNEFSDNDILRSICYKSVAIRLKRFYDDKKVSDICSQIPQEYRELC